MAGPLIIGHRGASALAPENTLAAFRLAIEAGADGLEFDVRLARDGVPIVAHDSTMQRTANVGAAVDSLTSPELGRIDIGSWFNVANKGRGYADFSGESIPTLAQTLEFLDDFDGRIFIELKCGEHDHLDLTAAVCELLKNSRVRPQVIIKSFKLSVITQAKILLPSVRTAALFAPKIASILRKEKHLVKIANELGADELSLHYSLATRKLMEKALKRGLSVNIWTINSARLLRRARRLGIASVITDDPAKLLAKRRDLTRDEQIR